MISKIKSRIKAFSLIELSIVILIISIITTGALSVSKTSIRNANQKITKDRMTEIYRALTNYLAANRRLPCPAALTNANTSGSYGVEVGTAGTCSGTGVTNVSGNLVYGMVPIAALGLANEMGGDGFGTKFSYMVDRRFTAKSTSPSDTAGFEIIAGQQLTNGPTISTIINVKEGTGTDVTTIAIMAIISHGANKYGGYNASGTTANTASAVSSETDNTVASLDAIIYNSSSNSSHDDIIMFKTKQQLIVDAGLEYIMCSYNESSYATGGATTLLFPTPGVYYNEVKTSSNSCVTPSGGTRTRTCGKYGVWGALNTSCTG